MRRVHALVLACAIAMAAWLSDHWVLMLPGLLGVMVGIWYSRQPVADPPSRGPLAGLSALLVLVSFVYLYVAFLILQVRLLQQLWALEEPLGRPMLGLLVGSVGLTLVLAGLGAVLILKLTIPRGLLALWGWLTGSR